MRTSFSISAVAGAIFGLLLPLALWGGSAQAQTITNVAKATWTSAGDEGGAESNPVEFEVTPRPPEIITYHPVPGTDGGGNKTYPQPICFGGQNPGDSVGVPDETLSTPVEEIETLRAGEDLVFEIRSWSSNLDRAAIDQLDVILTTNQGDREELRIFETGFNTGVFVGKISTGRLPPLPTQDDCRLNLANGDIIEIAATQPGEDAIVIQTDVDVLADPFGVVFDSETGEGVNGARVTLVDAATGLPAVVFAEDGVTPWPSTVISGQPITDGAGNVYDMGTGEYWFPLTSLGTYRLEIVPPAPYTAPSVVSPEDIARLSREDGSAFVILDASYGGTFTLNDPTPVEIDIPLDRPSLSVNLSKTANRAAAQPGDAVFYTLIARNQDPTRVKRNVVLVDTPSRWLRLRTDSVRIDGQAAPDAVQPNADGSRLTVNLGDIDGGSERRVTYAMIIRPDAPPGEAVNKAEATDSLGRRAVASAVLDIERESIAGRMTIVGRVMAGQCSIEGTRRGIPNVRVMMEDGSFAITDKDGRYHFEGVVPGTHVVQAARMTLPEGSEFVDCHRGTRNAGSASSRFAIGQGGSLVVADFHAIVPEGSLPDLTEQEALYANADAQIPGELGPATLNGEGLPVQNTAIAPAAPAKTEPVLEDSNATDWIAQGDGPDGWLTPSVDYNPRAPTTRVAIRHRRGQTINLFVDGEPVNKLAFEGTRTPEQGRFAVSHWRGVPLENEKTILTAEIVNSFGVVNETIERTVYFTNTPTRVELVESESMLVADGRTRPVVAIRVLDRNNRPLREGVSGEFKLNAPYQSASQLEQQQLNQLTGLGSSSARWIVEGSDGIARIELAPTMVSGSLRLDFFFDDGEIRREQELETWIVPGDIEWTVVGLAEGSVGARTVADNMERDGRFDSDLGDKARVALYAKGRVLGKFLTTIAYDSAKQRDDQRVLGTLDPNAYYTVFGDASSRRFDAASREKLYVRIETATFYALYGDFETGFDQTNLARYNRVATGVKGEARFGQVQAQGFAAEISTRFRRDEIQGQGISGPYTLGNRRIVANSETVTLETRDRFRSELIVSSRVLERFIDYDIDLLSGTITFSEPVLSRDFDLNPQFIVVDYEIDALAGGEMNAGLRADWTSDNGAIRIGATAITDKGEGARTDIGAVDLRARVGQSTEIRAELAASRSEGETATGWMVEAQHSAADLDVLAYARQLDADYGVGQQNGVELGRRKVGVDARVRLDERFSVLGSAWQDDSLVDDNRRRAAQVELGYQGETTDLRAGIVHFNDRLSDGTRNKSTVLEGGVTHRLFENALELSATSSVAIEDDQSIDLPTRHRFGARYALTDDVRLVGLYEVAQGDNVDARTVRGGIEVSPWTGSQVVTSIGKQRIDESGDRSFAAFGLSQTFQVSPELTLDATVDGSRTIGGKPDVADVVNVEQPIASGGQFGPGGNTLFEDFTAVTVGGAYRKDRWSATARAEYRDGEFANRKGVTLGAIRQLGEGSVVGSGFTFTEAEGSNGTGTQIMDAALAFAHRPDDSEIAMLGKLEYRSDSVTGAVAGQVDATGRTALDVTGDAQSRRLIASLSTNWSPRGRDEIDDVEQEVRRSEFGLFLGGRYNFDEFEGVDISGVTALAGLDARLGLGNRFEIGATGTVRSNLTAGITSFSFGPNIGFVPADGVLLTLGYNIAGFRDEDFSASRNTDKGIYASVRMKFDADTFGFLGLGR